MSILETAMQPDILDKAWNLLKTEHTPWSVTVDRDQLQRNLMRHLLTCREDVLSGRYQPEPLRQFAMTKPDGKQRIISAQYLRDKLVQRALLIVLEPNAEAIFHHDSYAYRRGRSVKMALDKTKERVRIGQDWLVDADISKFFDNIPLTPLQKKLKAFIKDSDALNLIDKWLKQGVHSSSLFGTSRGISQGAILSPMFCNLYMNEFDQALGNAHIPFVRFADDFLLFATDQGKAEKALVFARKKLNDMGLTLHPEKTRVIRSNRRVIFLGEPLPEARRVAA
ncbi:MAG: reverse transcriptase domain-containing protein [Thiothrix sp.]|uniref:reverse transcriptase domain-containing protein n=1 Tax=Thiothrix sp. TaxID=1032 RepID=UPI00261D3E11|nr:reverse transcriptase domain-containing protein [Thiothrix sp.]MDD5392724.1 reverse transcriptase domain-containing protein [Thiothrix sp.]